MTIKLQKYLYHCRWIGKTQANKSVKLGQHGYKSNKNRMGNKSEKLAAVKLIKLGFKLVG
jgi:hypothetical protein